MRRGETRRRLEITWCALAPPSSAPTPGPDPEPPQLLPPLWFPLSAHLSHQAPTRRPPETPNFSFGTWALSPLGPFDGVDEEETGLSALQVLSAPYVPELRKRYGDGEGGCALSTAASGGQQKRSAANTTVFARPGFHTSDSNKRFQTHGSSDSDGSPRTPRWRGRDTWLPAVLGVSGLGVRPRRNPATHPRDRSAASPRLASPHRQA